MLLPMMRATTGSSHPSPSALSVRHLYLEQSFGCLPSNNKRFIRGSEFRRITELNQVVDPDCNLLNFQYLVWY